MNTATFTHLAIALTAEHEPDEPPTLERLAELLAVPEQRRASADGERMN